MNEELQAIVERLVRRSLPLLDERYVEKRIALKVERAFERLPLMWSPGAQAVTHCNGVLRYEGAKLIVETGMLAVVEGVELLAPKGLVN